MDYIIALMNKIIQYPLISLLIFFPRLLIAQPTIQLNPAEWNAGEVEIGKLYQQPVTVKIPEGIGEITQVRPSCECLNAEITKKDLKDGGTVLLKLQPDQTLNARFTIFAYLHINNQTKPIARFNVTGKIKGKGFGLGASEIVFFRTKTAVDYELIRQKLQEVQNKHPTITIQDHLTSHLDSYRLFSQFEKEYQVRRYSDVEMFIGDESFIGPDEVLKKLDGLLVGPGIPPDKKALPVLYFYSFGCGGCYEIEKKLFPAIEQKYGAKIWLRRFDLADLKNYEFLMQLEKKYHVKGNSSVLVFAGPQYLAGSKEIINKLDGTIEQVLSSRGGTDFTTVSIELVTDGVDGEGSIRNRFKSFSTLALMGAGLLDGINPCAFATIIFFISFLTFVGRGKREIIMVGIFYTLAVFATYLFLGIGIFKTIQAFSSYHLLNRIILYVMVVMVFILAGLSLYDLVVYLRTKRGQGIILQLPLSLKQRIHTVIRKNVKPGRLILGALVTGFLVTLFEAVCTGQVYLPTIVFVLKEPELKVNAVFYLVLYNLMFIVPLIIIFILAYFGISSRKLSEFSRKNLVVRKVLMIIFFAGLGILLMLI